MTLIFKVNELFQADKRSKLSNNRETLRFFPDTPHLEIRKVRQYNEGVIL